MNESELKQSVARNITALRKQNNMTQAELAEKLCYSDKSISKWERGDGLPDVYVLTKIAELFGVTVNDLISEQTDEPISAPMPDTSTSRHILVTILSAGIVWFVAALVFVILKIALPSANWLWMSFICAIPVSAIVIVVFAHIWWGNLWRCMAVSLLVWGVAILTHLSMLASDFKNNQIIYLAASVFEVLVVLWYVYQEARRRSHSEKNNREQPESDPEPETQPEAEGQAEEEKNNV